jgi:tetratricopeptide (TPR) repeat protein
MSKKTQQVESAFRLGQQLHGAGRLAEAEQLYRQVLAAAPRHAEALHALGALALQMGHAEAADELLRQAIRIRPAADFQLTRGHALLALKRPAEAAECARLVLRGRPSSAEGHQLLGHAMVDSFEAEPAIEAYRTALRLNPGLPDLHNNLGTALRMAGRLEEAEAALRRAPPDPGALMNLSSVRKELGQFAAAEDSLRQALAMAPRDPILLYNWSLLMNLMGRPGEAWAGWEQRFRSGAVPVRPFPQPPWNGEPLGGRKLLVHWEQGQGDVIQFARYVPNIGGSVLFETPSRLVRLLRSNPAFPPIVGDNEPMPAADLAIPLMSLPARTNVTPVDPPYLFAELDRVAHWRQIIGETGFRIGIAWQGYSGRHEDKGRSLPLARFAPLAEVPGVRLISLQKGEGEEQIAEAPFPVETLPDLDAGPDAFIDTAAVMAVVDLVVTSDTSIAHLAGALGRPVWVALRKVPDWRWLLGRADSPWYPSMRLFRQRIEGDWDPVFQAVAREVAA